jgi:hypothetical protein
MLEFKDKCVIGIDLARAQAETQLEGTAKKTGL